MCEKLREIRGRIGLPWAFLLEMHGWWHIFTAMSAAWFMDILREVQIELKREKAA
jgi:dihydroceramidase